MHDCAGLDHIAFLPSVNQIIKLPCNKSIHTCKLKPLSSLKYFLTSLCNNRIKVARVCSNLSKHVEVLKLLSSQVAISIKNAQLYCNLQLFNENLEQLVEQRTRELSQALDNLKATQTKLVESEKMASLGGNDPQKYTCRFLDRVIVSGKPSPVAIFGIYDGDPQLLKELKNQTKSAFERGI